LHYANSSGCFQHCSYTAKILSSSTLCRETGQRISGNAALSTMRFSVVTRRSTIGSGVDREAEWSVVARPSGSNCCTLADYMVLRTSALMMRCDMKRLTCCQKHACSWPACHLDGNDGWSCPACPHL